MCALRGVFAACLALLAAPALAGLDPTSPADGADLTQLSLEDLANVKFTTASRSAKSLFEIAAPVCLITQEDIRRAGVTHLADALRMAPGVQVSQIGQGSWAVSMRGFNGRYANKLLVLVDGKSVYAPAYAGVLWETLDLPLDTVERIEVIRGPAGALWGANAVNGIVNIITCHTGETHGLSATARGAEHGNGAADVVLGGAMGPNGHYRVFGKWDSYASSLTQAGAAAADQWYGGRGGFRADWDRGHSNHFMLEGDAFSGIFGLAPPAGSTGRARLREETSALVGRWVRTMRDEGEQTLRLSWDRLRVHSSSGVYSNETFDLDWQHRLAQVGRHTLTFGGGYREYTSYLPSLGPPGSAGTRETVQKFSAFLEDDARLGRHLTATLGARLETNPGWDTGYQPSVRLAWTPSDRHTVWVSVSRAVANSEASAEPPTGDGMPAPGDSGPRPGSPSERVIAYELGYRTRPTERLSVDIASFYNSYGQLGAPGGGGDDDAQSQAEGAHDGGKTSGLAGSGKTYGIELQTLWRASDRWRLNGSYAYTRTQFSLADMGDAMAAPVHQASLRSMLDLGNSLELDTALYLVGAQAYQTNGQRRSVPGYLRLDLRLGWRTGPAVNVSFGVTNLLDARHLEYGSVQGQTANVVERTVYGRVTWRQ